ncbi:prolyl oligopeptidase family serine peptidase [Patescibacteria group bacterium]|nr:prolyl oligopeptidase family serine peptidase [Patescibacteria group bacterium]
MQKIRSVRSEKPFDMEKVQSPGLKIFIKRIRDRNKPNGIPFKVLKDSARSLAKQNLVEDGTIDRLAENTREARAEGKKATPVLILRGSNDFVVPHEGQTSNLYNELIRRGVDVEMVDIKAAGHGLTAEQPIKAGEIVGAWLEKKEIIL